MPTPWRVAAFLAAAAALNYGDRAVFSVVLPAIKTEFALSDIALGWLGSLFLWSYALASPVAGALADRFSRARLVTLSLLTWSFFTSLTGIVGGFASLACFRIGLGLGESLYMPAAVALLADHHGPASRARAMSVHITGFNIGIVLGGALAGVLAESYGWRASFLVLGLAGIGLGLSARFFVVDAATRSEAAMPPYPVGRTLRYLASSPSFFMLLSVAMLAGVAVWIFFNWFPLYLQEQYRFSLGTAGFAGMLLLQASSTLGILAGGWISDRVAARDVRRRLLVFGLGYLAAAPALVVFLFHPGFPVIAVCVALFSFCRAVAAVNELPVLCEIVPLRMRSTAVGFMNTAATAAGGLGVLVAAMLKRDFGLETVFAGLSGVYLVAALVMAISYRSFIGHAILRAQRWEAEIEALSGLST